MSKENDKSKSAPVDMMKPLVRFKHPCPYCKTGWARGCDQGGCTCEECDKPTTKEELHPMHRDFFESWTNQSNKRENK